MIPKQQIEAAKQANLPDVLRSLGIEIVLSGANFQSKNYDSLKFFRQTVFGYINGGPEMVRSEMAFNTSCAIAS